MRTNIAQALTLAFQYCNQTMPDTAIAEMAGDLSAYPPGHVLAALKRCRSELKVIRFSDILDRLPGGHPGPEEAWAIASRSIGGAEFEENEQATIVWTDEIREAFGAARVLNDDKVAARMAFKERYQQLVGEARAKKRMPHWTVSLGYDKAGRDIAVQEALLQGRLTQEHVWRVSPPLPPPSDGTMEIVKRI